MALQSRGIWCMHMAASVLECIYSCISSLLRDWPMTDDHPLLLLLLLLFASLSAAILEFV